MKFLALVAAPLLVLAAPTSLAQREFTVTDAEVNTLRLFSQYAGAAQCNGDVPSGSKITCANNGCAEVEAVGAEVVGTFGGVITDISGFVATDDVNKLIVVSYKGSTSLRNYLADFTFHRVSCNDILDKCEVHAGFSTANDETWVNMTTTLHSTVSSHPDYKIIFTGHSLGGAVSTLSAARARQQFNYSVDLYTYGSPRVGNEVFAQFVTDQAGAEYRVTHLSDPVPRLPPIFLGYRHTSPEYWLSNGQTNTTDYTAKDIKVCEGTANTSCNAGVLGLDADAHNYYLGWITACSPPFEFRKRDLEGSSSGKTIRGRQSDVPALHVTLDMATIETPRVSDEELHARLEEFALKDIAFAKSLA